MNTKLLNTFAAASAALLTLLGAAPARAGTITVVPLPGTNTDIATGITTNKTYVSCFDYGNRNATIYSVNGVPFAHPDFSAANNIIYLTNSVDPASGVWPSGGQILGGSVFLSTITNAAGNIGHIDQTSSAPPGTPGPQADGNTLNLLYDQIYVGNGQTVNDWMQEVYSNLVAGDNYSLRIYWRVQSSANANRLIDFWFNGEGTPQAAPGNPVSLDTNVVTHFSGAEYIEYDFQASGTTVSMVMTNIIGGQGSTTFFSTLEDDSYPYAPFITYQTSVAGIGNGIYQFNIQAIGTTNLAYQWYTNSVPSYSGAAATSDGNDYSGSTTNILTATNNLLDYYFAVVTNNYGSVTSSIVQINPAPTIVTQPTITANVGVSVQYSVTAGGFLPLAYQWYTNNANSYTGAAATGDGNDYSGSTNATLTATNYLADYYFVVVTNNYGSVTSAITAYNPRPAIVTQPVGSKVGGSLTLSMTANGWPTLAYQWYSNGVSSYSGAAATGNGNDYSGSTTANLAITNNLNDYYFVIVTNIYGSATSSIVQAAIPLTVLSAGEPIWGPTTNIIVTFSDLVDPTTGTTAGNYTLNNSATVSSATLVSSNEVALTTSPLTGSYTLTVKNVKDYPFGLTMTPSSTNLVVGVYPANIALWVKANTAVTTDAYGVNEWDDQSGNANDFYGPSGLGEDTGPVYDPQLATNAWGDPVIRFTGTNETQMLAASSPTLDITNDMSIIAVANFAILGGGNGTNGEIVSKTSAAGNIPAPYDYYVINSTTGARFYRGNGTAYGQFTASSVPFIGAPHILAVSETGNTVSHYLDGVANGTGILNNGFNESSCVDQGQDVYIGTRSDGANRLTGDLAELIIVNSPISSYDVAELTPYLAQEHNIEIVNSNPTNLVFSASSGNLTLSWPSDHTGWELQVQTNDLSVGISTNWSAVSGSTATNQVIIPISVTNGSVFYRLVYPAQ